MNFLKKNLILLVFLGLTTFINAQFLGYVKSVINIGSVDYAYIFVEEQGYYKTAAYETGLLNNGDELEIQSGNIPNTNYKSFIKTSNGAIGVYAVKVETESFNLPANSQFGMPVFEDDILWFQSKEHYDEFYEILRDFSNSPYEFMDDLLQVFEKQYPNFQSFNKMMRDKFDLVDRGLTDDELKTYHEFDYFKDEIAKTIINRFGEIGIANDVHVMFMHSDNKKCITYVADKSNIKDTKELRNVEKNEDLLLFYPALTGVLYIDGEKKTPHKKAVYGTDVDGNLGPDILYTSSFDVETVSCTTTKVTLKYKLVRSTFNDAHLVIDQALFDGTVTVNWGDGTSTTMDMPPIPVSTEPSGTMTMNHAYLNFSHEYALEGSYSISTSGVFTSEWINNPTQFTAADNEDWQSPDIACTGSSWSNKITPDPSFSSDHKAICEGWIRNFLVAHTVGAKTTNYKKVNGNWKKRQENISAEINAVFRNDDCDYKESKQEYDSGHERDIQAVKPKWWTKWSISNEDCYGTYTIEHYGSVYTYELIFNPCN